MISLENTPKTIGTLVPLSALICLDTNKNTFATGIVFLDWLKKTHQSAWQMLPLHQTQLELGSSTKHVPSPYKSYSIGLDPNYLPENFIGMYPSASEKADFVQAQQEWLYDYAFFCSLRDYFQTDDWRKWDEGLRDRDKITLAHWSNQLAKEIDGHIVLQWQLHTAYLNLRKKAKELGIILIGDLPFYPSLQSPLVWAHQKAFQIKKAGNMRYVSGIPNIEGAHFGRQIWGHPLYNWNNKDNVLALWKIRLHYQAALFDQIRFDHAKGIFEYGVIDTENENNDHLAMGPGKDVFEELITFSRKQELFIFAEDNGDKTKMLQKTLKELNTPGIKILRYVLKKDATRINANYGDIPNYPQNCVAYTTTHDTETLLGFLHSLTPEQKQRLAIAANVAHNNDDKTFAKTLRDAVITSPAQTVIIPLQDWLLTTDRINIPGTELAVNDLNWNFKLKIPIEHLPIYF